MREALVNAIAHRDYRSTASVQTYIFHDRLEIVSPGGLPAGMREVDLGTRSVPRNLLLFGVLYRMGLVEQIGSGIRRIRQLCRDYDAPEPMIDVSEHWFSTTFIRSVESATGTGRKYPVSGESPQGDEGTPQVAPQVKALVRALEGERTRVEILADLGLKDRLHLASHYLRPALAGGLVEMTHSDRPRSRNQKYRLTDKGQALLRRLSPPSDATDRKGLRAAQQVPKGNPSCTPNVPRKSQVSSAHLTGSGRDPKSNRSWTFAIGLISLRSTWYRRLPTGRSR